MDKGLDERRLLQSGDEVSPFGTKSNHFQHDTNLCWDAEVSDRFELHVLAFESLL